MTAKLTKIIGIVFLTTIAIGLMGVQNGWSQSQWFVSAQFRIPPVAVGTIGYHNNIRHPYVANFRNNTLLSIWVAEGFQVVLQHRHWGGGGKIVLYGNGGCDFPSHFRRSHGKVNAVRGVVRYRGRVKGHYFNLSHLRPNGCLRAYRVETVKSYHPSRRRRHHHHHHHHHHRDRDDHRKGWAWSRRPYYEVDCY